MIRLAKNLKLPADLARLRDDLYDDLGMTVADKFLRCRACGAEEHPSGDDMARYFRRGWPKCCGQTMRLTAHGEVDG